MRSVVVLWYLVVGLMVGLLGACSGSSAETMASKTSSPAPTPDPAPAWTGPPVQAVLEIMEGQPPQYAVAVSIEVPTGGYALTHDETHDGDDGQAVRLTLMAPGVDEITTQALETLKQRVEISAPSGSVRVEVKSKQRGTHYFVEPPHVLAATVEKP